jgi:hypothetical protein
MNRSNLYTPEILEAEIKRAKDMNVTEIDFSRYAAIAFLLYISF